MDFVESLDNSDPDFFDALLFQRKNMKKLDNLHVFDDTTALVRLQGRIQISGKTTVII